jgi:hypothetical protein
MLPSYQNVGVQPNMDPNAGIATGVGNLAPLLGAGYGYYAGQQGAEAQRAGSNAAQQTLTNYSGQATANASPYTAAGGAAMNALGSYYGLPGYGSFDPSVITNMPGYQFQQQQGLQAIQNSAAAKGLLNSGATMQAIAQYNQGLAGTYANNYASQLAGIGGMGLNATNSLNQNLGAAAQGIGSAQIYSGNATAGGYQNQAGAIGQGLNGLPQMLGGLSQIGNGFGNTFGFNQVDTSGFTGDNFNNAFDQSGLNNIQPIDPSLLDTPGGFNAAGGEAAQVASDAQSTSNAAFAGAHTSYDPSSGSSPFGSVSNDAGGALNAFNAFQGIERGGVSGYGGAALNAAQLYNRFGGADSQIPGVGPAANVMGIYNGIQQGGVMGYGGAVANAAQLANVPGAGYLTAPLSIYDFYKNGTASGRTGQDMLTGAKDGFQVGMTFGGPIGGAIGSVIGAAQGGIASLFGPGARDPEGVSWNQYAAAYDKSGGAGVAGASPAQNFQALTGIFDSRGSNIPFYNKYGRQGENQFTSDMMNQVNSAIKAGKISTTSSPQQIYSQVVEPWITSMGGKSGWQNTYTNKGASEKDAVGNVLTNLIGQWQGGQITNGTQLGVSGEHLQGGVPAFGAAQQQTQQPQQQANQPPMARFPSLLMGSYR